MELINDESVVLEELLLLLCFPFGKQLEKRDFVKLVVPSIGEVQKRGEFDR